MFVNRILTGSELHIKWQYILAKAKVLKGLLYKDANNQSHFIYDTLLELSKSDEYLNLGRLATTDSDMYNATIATFDDQLETLELVLDIVIDHCDFQDLDVRIQQTLEGTLHNRYAIVDPICQDTPPAKHTQEHLVYWSQLVMDDLKRYPPIITNNNRQRYLKANYPEYCKLLISKLFLSNGSINRELIDALWDIHFYVEVSRMDVHCAIITIPTVSHFLLYKH